MGHDRREMELKPASSRNPRERGAVRPPELFTASDVARFCQVDLKTIHNWADKGEIPHFRTPGRHLRFRRLDVLDFLRKYGYAIPDVLRHSKPRVVVIDRDASVVSTLKRTLAKRFEVIAFQDPVDALIALAGIQPDGLVIDLDLPGCDVVHFLQRLHALESTSHIRIFVFTEREEMRVKATEAGAIEVVGKDDIGKLREILERMMGLDR